jgi:phosphate/phosphite/phosphonate ABC transporter binding protein
VRRQFAPLAAHLERRIKIPVEIVVPKSYAELARAFINFDVHVATLSPLNYVRVREKLAKFPLLATTIADGKTSYDAYLVVRSDSGIRTTQDLQDKRLSFVDRNSTSGFLYPMAYFSALNIIPEAYFSRVTFAGDHASVIRSVLDRDADVGAVYSLALKQMRVREKEGHKLRVLATTGRIPYDAYCAHSRLAPRLTQELRQALLELSPKTAQGREILGAIKYVNGFATVDDHQYNEVRRVLSKVRGRAGKVDEEFP